LIFSPNFLGIKVILTYNKRPGKCKFFVSMSLTKWIAILFVPGIFEKLIKAG